MNSHLHTTAGQAHMDDLVRAAQERRDTHRTKLPRPSLRGWRRDRQPRRGVGRLRPAV